jgi:hypothetical protein
MCNPNFSITTALDNFGWSTPRPVRFTPGRNPVPTTYEAGWAQRTFWSCAVNLAHAGIRFPDRPPSSFSLYRLSYPSYSINNLYPTNLVFDVYVLD